MKKLIIILFLLPSALITSAQTFVSNGVFSYAAQFERIGFSDEAGNEVVALASRFYKQPKQKKQRIKPLKIDGQNYTIKLGPRGLQSVYDESGKHVANMQRNGNKIQIIEDNVITYHLRSTMGGLNTQMKCKNSDGDLVSELSFNDDRKLEYNNYAEKDHKLLLMSLCIHKYQELLVLDREMLVLVGVSAL